MAHPEVRVLPDPHAVAREAVSLVGTVLGSAVADVGRASVALSGGSGPQAAYEALAGSGLPWDRIDVFQVDERVVPRHDERSNWRMITRTLLEPAAVPPPRRHPIPVESLGPTEAAERYEDHLREVLGPEPRLDVCVMGVGPDGHTASLFPGTTQLDDPGLVTSGPAGFEPFVPRVTLTFRAINDARVCLFLVTGEEKAHAVAAALAPTGHVYDTPARAVQPVHGRLVWLLDRAAAGKLP